MMLKNLDVICAGAAIVDILLQPVSKNIFDTESYPLEKIEMTTGGDAINEAIILSRLGRKTALLSKIGADSAGAFIQEACRENGIDYASLHVEPGLITSMNVGLVAADGERTFVTNRNGSLWKLCAKDIDISRFSQAKILSLASIFNAPLLDGKSLEGIFSAARDAGMMICADMIKPRLGETLEDIRKALGYLDYFFPNYEEAVLLTQKRELDEIADVFLACGVKNIVIKAGNKGCYIKNAATAEIIAAVEGISSLDTTGAGDNFASGFIAGILEGKSIRECGQLANVTAAISVQSLGATTGVRNRQQVEDLYKDYLKKQK
jgi:sugar/nucleoside kinase (ribokinase family)